MDAPTSATRTRSPRTFEQFAAPFPVSLPSTPSVHRLFNGRLAASQRHRLREVTPASLCGIDWLFRSQRRSLSLTMVDPLNFTFVDKLRPPCSRCGRPLILTRIEPWDPGFDLRIYYCAHCGDHETTISAI